MVIRVHFYIYWVECCFNLSLWGWFGQKVGTVLRESMLGFGRKWGQFWTIVVIVFGKFGNGKGVGLGRARVK